MDSSDLADAHGPPLILLVDDEPAVLHLWRTWLSGFGYDVVVSGDGRTALRLARTMRIDLLVLDIDLPDISGVEVARRLRSYPPTHHLPLIALTGGTSAAQRDRMRDAGFDVVLFKPCEPASLLEEVERLVPVTPP